MPLRKIFVLLLIALIFLSAGYSMHHNNQIEHAHYIAVTGHIIDNEHYSVYGGGARGQKYIQMYTPIIQFTTADGQITTFNDSIHKGSPYTIGTPTQVLYDPENPQHVETQLDWVSNWLTYLFIGVGSLALIRCIVLVIPLARRRA